MNANQKSKNNFIWGIILIVISIAGATIVNQYFFKQAKVGYIFTPNMMVGFKDAAKIDKELQEEDEKWRKNLSELQDSLKAHMDLMTKEYDRASPKRKKQLQDLLSAKNQQVNNYRIANEKRMIELKNKKLKPVIEKINVFLGEYGKKENYSMIFGAVLDGTIMYGDDAHNITEEVVAALNERYK